MQTTKDALAWTRSYYVQQRFIAEAMTAPRTAAEAQHAARRQLRAELLWLSPAQALTAASERTAGVDSASLARFLATAETHKQAWDEALFRALLAGRNLGSVEFDRLPRFEPPPVTVDAKPMLTLFLLHTLLGALLWRASRWRVLAGSG